MDSEINFKKWDKGSDWFVQLGLNAWNFYISFFNNNFAHI